MELLKEDGTTPLNNEAAQDYINELEAQVKILIRSKASLVHNLDEYQGETGLTVVMKGLIIDMLAEPDVIDVLKDEILDVLKDEILDGLPDLNDLDDRVSAIEFDLENLPDSYEITDTVTESMDFESKTRELVAVALQDISIETKIDTTNLE
jgi:hypothetical protein